MTALSADEVACWRQRFPILERRTYLVNHSLGAMPASVPEALNEFTGAWAEHGVEAWPEWLAEVRRVADLVGSLIGAPPGSVVMHQNVATLAAMFLSALPRADGRTRVVLAEDEWPGHRYLLAEHRGRLDPVVVTGDALLDAIDERTALVLTSHVRFRDARILDVGAVVARAREVGALVLADGYHAAGLLPVDVTALGVDGYVGGSVKWLCGGPGAGWLYLRPATRTELRPAAVGWLAHSRPFAFEPDWEAAQDAMGWLGGTPSVPAMYAAREGYRIIAEVTPARVRATSKLLTAHLVSGAVERGLRVRTALEPGERGGTVTIDIGDLTAVVAERLSAAGIVVDARPGAGIRVGAHFFNTVEECEMLLDAVERERDGAGA